MFLEETDGPRLVPVDVWETASTLDDDFHFLCPSTAREDDAFPFPSGLTWSEVSMCLYLRLDFENNNIQQQTENKKLNHRPAIPFPSWKNSNRPMTSSETSPIIYNIDTTNYYYRIKLSPLHRYIDSIYTLHYTWKKTMVTHSWLHGIKSSLSLPYFVVGEFDYNKPFWVMHFSFNLKLKTRRNSLAARQVDANFSTAKLGAYTSCSDYFLGQW